MSRDVSPKFAFWVLVPFLVFIGLLILNREKVQDWWYFRSYEPTFAIENLASLGGLSEEGKKLLFRADPELIPMSQISSTCDERQVLGCLVTGPKIFIIDYTKGDSKERDQAVVTAAHEMLHMAYFRLSDDAKFELDPLIDAVVEMPSNRWLVSYLAGLEGDEYYDEAYAMIGTEIPNIGAALESHFREYFLDRTEVLDAYRNSKFVIKGRAIHGPA